MTFPLQLSFLSENAHIPTKGSSEAAGYDLYSAYDYIIPAHQRQLVKTDIAIKVPLETYGRIAPRSGLALKNGIDVFAGVIDRDYRGNIGIVLYNSSEQDFHIERHHRVAQLIIEKIQETHLEMVDDLNKENNNRQNNGFGSTGQ